MCEHLALMRVHDTLHSAVGRLRPCCTSGKSVRMNNPQRSSWKFIMPPIKPLNTSCPGKATPKECLGCISQNLQTLSPSRQKQSPSFPGRTPGTEITEPAAQQNRILGVAVKNRPGVRANALARFTEALGSLWSSSTARGCTKCPASLWGLLRFCKVEGTPH